MTRTLNHLEDPRIAELLDVIVKFASGDLKARARITDEDSTLAGVMTGINMLGEELEAYVAEKQQAEDALRDSEKHHQAIIASALDAIIVNDAQGRIVEFNPAAERMFGYLREQVLGRELADLVIPNSDGGMRRKIFKEELARGIPAFQGRRVEVPALHADGHEFPVELAVLRIEQSASVFFAGFARDLTERKRVEKALRAKEESYRLLFESSRDALMTLAPPSWRFTSANRATLELFGVASKAAFTALGPWELSPQRQPDGRPSAEKAQDMIATAMREGKNFFEWEHQRLDGRPFPANVLLTRMDLGGDVFLQATVRDITERRNQERALRESEERFKSILENVVEMFFIADGSLHAEYLSPRCADICGYTSEEMLARPTLWSETIHPEDKTAVLRQADAQLRSGAKSAHEFRILRKDGSARWVRAVANPKMGADGKLQRVYGTVTDITEFESLRSSLNEKEVLLKEIHHRVKNNLQIVISLMRLESRAFSEERVRAALKDLETRIRAMALVHEHLYHSSDLAKIGFKDYVKGLCQELFRTYRADGGRIALEIDAEAVALDIERAIPCGLIINELLTNAIKYAYPGKRTGLLRVAIRNTSDHQVEIVVSDDGIGIPDTLDIRRSQTLGLQLVTTLVENQLKGKVELERAGGTRFSIHFGI